MEVVKRTLTDEGEVESDNQFSLNELEAMAEERQQLQTKITDLNDTIDSLMDENKVLEEEANEARSSFTALQLAVGILVFVYGLMYGRYTC